MRLILTMLLTIITVAAISQQIDKDEKDDFTGTRRITTKPFAGSTWKKTDFIDNKFNVLFNAGYSKGKDNEGVYLLSLNIITTVKFGCLSEYKGKIMLLFENDSTMTLKQLSKTDCSSSVLAANYIPLDEEQAKDPLWKDLLESNVKILAENKVKKLRVYGSEGYYDFEIKDDKRDIIIQHLKSIQTKL